MILLQNCSVVRTMNCCKKFERKRVMSALKEIVIKQCATVVLPYAARNQHVYAVKHLSQFLAICLSPVNFCNFAKKWNPKVSSPPVYSAPVQYILKRKGAASVSLFRFLENWHFCVFVGPFPSSASNSSNSNTTTSYAFGWIALNGSTQIHQEFSTLSQLVALFKWNDFCFWINHRASPVRESEPESRSCIWFNSLLILSFYAALLNWRIVYCKYRASERKRAMPN